jgi:endoglucanase
MQGLRYRCWARTQLQYMLGASGHTYIVGIDNNSPTHVASPAASCPTTMQVCASPKNSSRAFLSPEPNPHVLKGALLYGPDAMDHFTDDRSMKDTDVNIAYNAGFLVAVAQILERVDWLRCDENMGLLAALGIDLPGTFF